MTNQMSDISIPTSARIAGFLYLTIIVSGIFAEFFVRSGLIVSGDATATAANIIASEGFFRSGIAADLIMIMSDVALALFFYIVLKPVNRSLSLLAAFFRLIQAAVLGVNLLNLVFVLHLLNGADYLAVIGTDRLYALVLLFLKAHSSGYSIGLVFFGISCFILGYLIFKSSYIPKILGILLTIAAIGYLTDSFANFLLNNYENYQNVFALMVFLPALVAELSLCLWLIIKGVKIPEIKGAS